MDWTEYEGSNPPDWQESYINRSNKSQLGKIENHQSQETFRWTNNPITDYYSGRTGDMINPYTPHGVKIQSAYKKLAEDKGYEWEQDQKDKGDFPLLLDKLNEIRGGDKWDRIETNVHSFSDGTYERIYVQAIKEREGRGDEVYDLVSFTMSQLPGFCAVSMIHNMDCDKFQFDGIHEGEYDEALDMIFDAFEDRLGEVRDTVLEPGSGIGDGPGNLGVYIAHRENYFLIKYLEKREGWELDLSGENPKSKRNVKMLRYLIP